MSLKASFQKIARVSRGADLSTPDGQRALHEDIDKIFRLLAGEGLDGDLYLKEETKEKLTSGIVGAGGVPERLTYQRGGEPERLVYQAAGVGLPDALVATAWQIGGNTIGATSTLGSNDGFNVQLIRGGVVLANLTGTAFAINPTNTVDRDFECYSTNNNEIFRADAGANGGSGAVIVNEGQGNCNFQVRSDGGGYSIFHDANGNSGGGIVYINNNNLNCDFIIKSDDGTEVFKSDADALSNKGEAIFGTAVRLPTYTDATRPAAGTAGRLIFNSDDGLLNIDDGSNWTLPDGTTT